MVNHFFFAVIISTNHCNNFLVHFVDRLFHVLQTLDSQWLPDYNINMISSNILPLDFFLFQHQPLDIFVG